MPTAISHHGAVNGVTGSCHQLTLADGQAVLVDCGLFQGAETSGDGAGANRPEIDFPIDKVRALVVTHVHIDHVGRIPYLIAAGFRGPILCSEASAALLPLVLEDALKIGFTRDPALINRYLAQIRQQTVPLPYKQWHSIIEGDPALRVKLAPAGHILGSAWVEFESIEGKAKQRIVFSGDLGAPYTPLLPAPQSPYGADVVVMESTYGDRIHESRKDRRQHLQALCEHAFRNKGSILIPAFSIGRTQELLYEFEDILHRQRSRPGKHADKWGALKIHLDSPLAQRFTALYRELQPFWDAEARARVRAGRQPLAYEQLVAVDTHERHLANVERLARSREPAVVIAASGMCAGGRVVNYLREMLGDPRHDVLFVGYQARGTPGHAIQTYGPRGGYVEFDGERVQIRAAIHSLSGYSAHADRDDLTRFVTRMRHLPGEVRLVHGEDSVRAAFAGHLEQATAGKVRVVV